MKKIISITIILFLISCSEQNKSIESSKKSDLNKEIIVNQLASEPQTTMWISENTEPYLQFSNDNKKIFMWFDGQCVSEYPIFNQFNVTYVLFDTIMDCKHFMSFKNTFNLKNYPKVNLEFMTLEQLGDTLFATYLYPDWTDSINTMYPKSPPFEKQFVLSIEN